MGDGARGRNPVASVNRGHGFGRRSVARIVNALGGRADHALHNFPGVGSASKLTWNALTGMDYRIKENMSVRLVYAIYDMAYSNGSVFKKFGFDAKMHGPTFAIVFHF